MMEMMSLDQLNFTGLIVLVFVMRNEIKNLGRRVDKLEDRK